MTLPLSVVIPTRNRCDLLIGTLRTLAAQQVSCEFEIIVVADGCTDNTEEAVTALAGSGIFAAEHLRLVSQPWRGAAAARNTGLTNANGRIVLFLDDDMEASSGLVASHLYRHDENSGIQSLVIVGRIVPQGGHGALQKQLDQWWREHYKRMESAELNWTAVYTGNVSVPKELASRVEGFDEALRHGEDIEFGYRLSKAGAKFVYAPEALAHTGNPKEPAALLGDFEKSGGGAVRIYRKSPRALRLLPLSAYGETNLRMRVARGLLLTLCRVSPVRAAIDRSFRRWAASRGGSPIDRPLFELARSYYYWRGVRNEVRNKRVWRKLASPGVNILMYHSIRHASGEKRDRYSVEPAVFRRQMSLLRLMGYRVEPLSSVAEWLRNGEQPPPKTVVLTFDDGYRDNAENALPVLGQNGYPATVFLVTGCAGGVNTWDLGNSLPAKSLLSWEEASRLDHARLQVEAHSHSHADLLKIGREELKAEIVEPAKQIQKHLQRPARFFAYPYGHYDERVSRLVKEAGYLAAVSAAPGLNTLRTDLYGLKRVEVRGDESIFKFALRVWAGDDPFRFLPGKSRRKL